MQMMNLLAVLCRGYTMSIIKAEVREQHPLHLVLRALPSSKKTEMQAVLQKIQQIDLTEEGSACVVKAQEQLDSYEDFDHLDHEALGNICLLLTELLCDVVEPFGDDTLENSMKELICRYLPSGRSLQDYQQKYERMALNKIFKAIEKLALSQDGRNTVEEAKELLSCYGDFQELDEKALDGISLILTGLLCDVVIPLGDQVLEENLERFILGFIPEGFSFEEYKENHLVIQRALQSQARLEQVATVALDQIYQTAGRVNAQLQKTFAKGRHALMDQDQKRRERIQAMHADLEGITKRVSELFEGAKQAAAMLTQIETDCAFIKKGRMSSVGDCLKLIGENT